MLSRFLIREDNEGKTALIWAIEKGHTEVVKKLIETGADLDVEDNEDSNAFTRAVINGDTELVNMLIGGRR